MTAAPNHIPEEIPGFNLVEEELSQSVPVGAVPPSLKDGEGVETEVWKLFAARRVTLNAPVRGEFRPG